VRDEVAHLAAHRAPCFVEADLGSELAELACQTLRDAALAPREAVDLDQLEEKRLQARGLDHVATLGQGPRRGQRGLSHRACGRIVPAWRATRRSWWPARVRSAR